MRQSRKGLRGIFTSNQNFLLKAKGRLQWRLGRIMGCEIRCSLCSP